MQVLYSMSRNEAYTEKEALADVKQSMLEFRKAYHFILFAATEVIEFVNTDAVIKAAKHLPSATDKELSLKLLSNPYYEYLNQDNTLTTLSDKEKFKNMLPGHIVGTLYKKLKESEQFENYTANALSDENDDYNIFHHLIMDVLLDSDVFLQHMEDTFPTWYDDDDFIAGILLKRLKMRKPKKLVYHEDRHWTETSDFAYQLVSKTIDHEDELQKEIDGYLKNWDASRLALMDTLLMKMALSELIYFKDIPVKVSINEYIDISKTYSTPKSKDFINGILDKAMKDLMQSGKIVKIGRGLKN